MCRTTPPPEFKKTMLRCFCCCKATIVTAVVLVLAGASALAVAAANTNSRDNCIATAKQHCTRGDGNKTAEFACATSFFDCANKGELYGDKIKTMCPGVTLGEGNADQGCQAWNDRLLADDSEKFHFR